MKLTSKILLLIAFCSFCPNSPNVWGQSIDTSCLSNDRLSRIADTISYHKFEHYRFKQLSIVQSGTIQIMQQNDSLYRLSFQETNKQLGQCQEAFLMERENSQRWKDQAEKNQTYLNEQIIETNKQFKRKNTFKGLFWGTLGAGVLSTIAFIIF